MTEEIKRQADKIVSDTLDSYMKHEVVKEERQTDLEDDYLGGRQTRKTEVLPTARSVGIGEPDRVTARELAKLVRHGGREAEMSSFVLIKYADLMMRELDNALECGRLIWKSERDAFEVKLMLEEMLKKRVLFQTSLGELLPVKVV